MVDIKHLIQCAVIICSMTMFASSCSKHSENKSAQGEHRTVRERIGRKDVLTEAASEPFITLPLLQETSVVTLDSPIVKLQVVSITTSLPENIKPLDYPQLETADLNSIDALQLDYPQLETADLNSIDNLSVAISFENIAETIDALQVDSNFNYNTEVIAGLPINTVRSMIDNTPLLSEVSVALPHAFEWAAPAAMSDGNAESWSKKVPSYNGFPEVKKQAINSVFAYGEAVATDDEVLYDKQLKVIKNVVGKGYNTIILSYYGGESPASVSRLVDDIHGSGAKVLFAVSAVEFFRDRSTLGFSVSEFDALMTQVANKIDYFLPSWRGLSPLHGQTVHAFTATISHMAVEKNPNLVVFGMADIYLKQVVSLVIPGSSAVIITRPVVDKKTMLWITDSSASKYNAPGAKVICGPVCSPSIYVPQDTNSVAELEKVFMDNHWGFFRLHGDGHQQNDAMTN